MRFDPPLLRGKLLRRYKRFFADVELDSGELVTAHCPNSGSMRGVAIEGQPIAISRSDNPKRKLKFSWELIQLDGAWVGVHTGRTNSFAEEAIAADQIPELLGYSRIRREVKYGEERSRIDLLLEADDRPDCYVEVKNVTLAEGPHALFPDSVTTRGQKHLRELMAMVAAGHRAVLLFWVNRADCVDVSPADAIDPEYGRLLRESLAAGVEILPYASSVSPEGVAVGPLLPLVFGELTPPHQPGA